MSKRCAKTSLKHVLKPGCSSNTSTITVWTNCKIECGIWSQAPFSASEFNKSQHGNSTHQLRDIKIKRSQIGHTRESVFPSLSLTTSIAPTIWHIKYPRNTSAVNILNQCKNTSVNCCKLLTDMKEDEISSTERVGAHRDKMRQHGTHSQAHGYQNASTHRKDCTESGICRTGRSSTTILT